MEKNLENIFDKNLREHLEIIENLKLKGPLIGKAVDKICKCFYNNGCLLVMGNGGSFADAIHIEGELVGRYKYNRNPFPFKAIGTGGATLTALSNDFLYEESFAREVNAYARENDILLGLSTSGNSENIIRAFEEGRKIRTYNILLTGKTGGKISQKEIADLIINVDSEDTPRIQEAHQLIYHTMCEAIEKKMLNWKK